MSDNKDGIKTVTTSEGISEQEVFAASLLQNMAGKLKGTPLYDNALSLLDYIQHETFMDFWNLNEHCRPSS